jgi:hypothetical protein
MRFRTSELAENEQPQSKPFWTQIASAQAASVPSSPSSLTRDEPVSSQSIYQPVPARIILI